MSYLSIFLVGAVIGMLISIFLHAYFSKGNIERRENKFLATKDDIAKITIELEELKNLYKNTGEGTNKITETKNEIIENTDEGTDTEDEIMGTPENSEISEAEKEFYDSIAGEE
jgi:sensor histidine kinase YesM